MRGESNRFQTLQHGNFSPSSYRDASTRKNENVGPCICHSRMLFVLGFVQAGRLDKILLLNAMIQIDAKQR
jgi:hypothetical protein